MPTLLDEIPHRLQSFGIASGVFRQPLQHWPAEYAGWVRIVGTWVHTNSAGSPHLEPKAQEGRDPDGQLSLKL
jgi:hypothetical protein